MHHYKNPQLNMWHVFCITLISVFQIEQFVNVQNHSWAVAYYENQSNEQKYYYSFVFSCLTIIGWSGWTIRSVKNETILSIKTRYKKVSTVKYRLRIKLFSFSTFFEKPQRAKRILALQISFYFSMYLIIHRSSETLFIIQSR